MPLSGIRVVDLTFWLMGPIASAVLADLGAEVIKIEKPGSGDFMRWAGSFQGRNLNLPNGQCISWEQANRNKKGITLNLYKKRGKEVLYRLVEESSVFVTNISGGALREMGADYDSLIQHNPRLIYARASAFGSKGPDAESRAQDTTAMARSGFLMNSRLPSDEPYYTAPGSCDVMAGTMCAFGIVLALLARERGGVAQYVDTSLLGSMMWLQSVNVALGANFGYDFLPFDRKKQTNALINVYKCQDGKWIALGLYATDRFWHDFCEVMGITEYEKDPRYQTEIVRKSNCEELIRILDKAFATKPRKYWERAFRERKLWFSAVNTMMDLPNDPQVIANEYIGLFERGLRFCTLPFQLSEMKTPLRGRAPELGQHTEEVLHQICGYKWSEIEALSKEGVI